MFGFFWQVITSLILFVIGVVLLINVIMILIVVKIGNTEFVRKLEAKTNILMKKISETLFIFLILYLPFLPILFVMMFQKWLSIKNTSEANGKEGFYLSCVHFPLLLISIAGWLYLISILIT